MSLLGNVGSKDLPVIIPLRSSGYKGQAPNEYVYAIVQLFHEAIQKTTEQTIFPLFLLKKRPQIIETDLQALRYVRKTARSLHCAAMAIISNIS